MKSTISEEEEHKAKTRLTHLRPVRAGVVIEVDATDRAVMLGLGTLHLVVAILAEVQLLHPARHTSFDNTLSRPQHHTTRGPADVKTRATTKILQHEDDGLL